MNCEMNSHAGRSNKGRCAELWLRRLSAQLVAFRRFAARFVCLGLDLHWS